MDLKINAIPWVFIQMINCKTLMYETFGDAKQQHSYLKIYALWFKIQIQSYCFNNK